jgi:hypothetical protein
MKHSGWRKGNRTNRKSTTILLIILFSAGLFCTFPEVAIAFEFGKTEGFSILMGSVPLSSHYSQNKKHTLFKEGYVSTDNSHLVPQKVTHITDLPSIEALYILGTAREKVLDQQE